MNTRLRTSLGTSLKTYNETKNNFAILLNYVETNPKLHLGYDGGETEVYIHDPYYGSLQQINTQHSSTITKNNVVKILKAHDLSNNVIDNTIKKLTSSNDVSTDKSTFYNMLKKFSNLNNLNNLIIRNLNNLIISIIIIILLIIILVVIIIKK